LKFVRFSTNRNEEPTAPPGTPGVHWGVLEEGQIRSMEGSPFGHYHVTGLGMSPDEVRLLPPCYPSKIVCVGRNYVEHAKELDHDVPTEPLIFMKPPSAIAGDGDIVHYPQDSQRLDHEGEIGIVIGRRMRHLGPKESAFGYILGYTCLNDVTARDLQKKDGQWTRGKGFDTFCPFGPAIATGLDASQLEVKTYLNGQLRQQGHVKQMIFDFDVVLRYISRFMTLEPGDVIATGTPAGVGPMQIGDTVEVVIEGIGTLRNVIGGPA